MDTISLLVVCSVLSHTCRCSECHERIILSRYNDHLSAHIEELNSEVRELLLWNRLVHERFKI